jgi:pimeloyl-ACP methyl ester carboxylesterase
MLFKAAALAMAGLAAPVAAQREPRRPAEASDLFVRDWGEGPALLFLHGWGLASDSWNYVMLPLVERGFRCIAYDRRGHGRSADPGRGYEFDTLADDLARIIAARGLTDLTLVGHSMAAGELVRYMSRHGGRGVARLVFVAPAGTPFMLRTADNPRGIDGALLEASRARAARDLPAQVEANLPPFFAAETSPAMRAWLARMMENASLHALIECNRAMTTTDFRPELARIDRPSLVIHGTADASVPLELTGRPTAAAIPGARLTVYEGAPHGLILTHAARLAQDIAAFARG